MRTVFQPIVDLNTGGTVGAEALARFNTPPLRPPDVWFAEAAGVGLGVELEVAALHSSLEQLRKLPSGLYLSVNASPATMVSPEFRSVMADVVAERVVLELTEHTGIDDYEELLAAISQYRSSGARLAVDDAGSGISSFRHILNMRPDIIKLDISLTTGINTDPARKALARALLTFGLDAYDASIVAEGIENVAELRALRALGFRYGQGFYLGKPGDLPLLRPDGADRSTLRRGTIAPISGPRWNGPKVQSDFDLPDLLVASGASNAVVDLLTEMDEAESSTQLAG